VRLVWTGDDLADLAPLPCLAMGEQKDGEPIHVPPRLVLARGRVRHVGEPIAFIVADDLSAARAAAELIEVDYAPLPAIVDTAAALADGAPLVWPDRGSNIAFTYERGDQAAAEAAFGRAAKVARLRLVNSRVVSNYIEPRAVLAEYDPEKDRYTLTLGSQGVHGMRAAIAKVLNLRSRHLHIITPDVGGGFGTKMFCYHEYPLAAHAARALGRPVRWVSDRFEHFVADSHGRDNVTEAEAALDEDGRVLALRVRTIANMGAFLAQAGPLIPWVGSSMATGLYDIPALHLVCRGVYSNTVPVDAYRGAGRPEAAYMIERLMDEAARVAGLSPPEIRRRNFIRPDQLPYRTATGRSYDSGEFEGHLDKALEVAGWDGFEARAEESRSRGRLRGIGLASYVEACAFAGTEWARVELEADGGVALFIGTQTNGQGHQTAYAQFVAEPLGLDYDRIRVVQGDSDLVAKGGGTGGSRSIPLGVPAAREAARSLAENVKKLASDRLEVAAADVELANGEARVVGTDRAISLADLAARAEDKELLTGLGEYESPDASFPNGTHVCELEIDPETGSVEVLAYTIVDDFGAVVNPLLLEGQIHGGAAQGLGQALIENTFYDADGQLLTASFNDYAMPRAWDLPFFHFETRNVPTRNNPLGIKGAGEAGTIGAAPAVMNAVVDSLWRGCGIRHLDMPATSQRIWAAIRAAEKVEDIERASA
ncbi:MAG TPA: xanthine dehydrogenase family protein molybdopterin-binding subunit, partial [Afifellaceae bacterium]|nr:xanthine dehydrogenase family protein molybdopterin-binding subunit [Afifellaceae bacterium]